MFPPGLRAAAGVAQRRERNAQPELPALLGDLAGGVPVEVGRGVLARKGVDATVTIAHSRTPDLAAVCREADILVGAAGAARMITADHVKPGAAVIDVGVSRTEEGRVGDVDFDAVQGIAGAITPRPGGTGPMPVACLLENTLAAARMQGAFPA